MSALGSILDVNFYPFGNAYWPQSDMVSGLKGVYDHDERVAWQLKCGGDEVPSECYEGELLCQHGPNECLVNAVEACVLQMYPDPQIYIPFAACAEMSFPESEPCAVDVFRLDWDAIESCATSPVQVKNMAMALGHSTAIAKPEGTPTIVVDGETIASPELLFRAVCQAYQGDDLPEACGKVRGTAIDFKEIEQLSKRLPMIM